MTIASMNDHTQRLQFSDLDPRYRYLQARESSARTYAKNVPLVFERASQARLFDAQGREYLDCLSCAGTLALGHNHPFVTQRVHDHLRSGQAQQALDLSTPEKYQFVRQLYDMLPASMSSSFKVQFCGPTGADAVEAALKLFKTATGRHSVLAFHGGYHGMSAGALAMTGNLEAKRYIGALMAGVHFLPYPYAYRCPFGLGDGGTPVSLNYIERLLSDPESGITKPAAVVLEAIQGEGGVVPAPADWLRGLRDITRRHEVPLVVDEVQTGLGRTGHLFAFELAGIEPDAVCLSKAIGGGYPMSVLLYHERHDKWSSGAHAGTFRGNQIAMVAGQATMEFIQRENLTLGVRAKGSVLGQRLRELASEFPIIGDVRGRGLMWGIEIVQPEAAPDAIGSLPADGAMARRIKQACLQAGMLIESGGRHGAVLRLLPPLIISESEIHEIVAKLKCGITAALANSKEETHV